MERRGSRRGLNRSDEIPQVTAADDAVERIAGHEHELILPLDEADRRGSSIDDLTALYHVSLPRSLNGLDHDLILPRQSP